MARREQKLKTEYQLLVDKLNALKSQYSELTKVKLSKRSFNAEKILFLKQQINEIKTKLSSWNTAS